MRHRLAAGLAALVPRDDALLHVKPIRLGSNHQVPGSVQNLCLKIVHSAMHLRKRKAQAADRLRCAVEINSHPVARFQPRLQIESHVQNARDIP